MKFSRFAPFGLFQFKGGTPEAETIYRSLLASFGEQYLKDSGSRIEAWCYAKAIGIARANRRLRKAVEQRLPWLACEGLPNLEREFGIVPGPQDTIGQRRAVATVRAQLPRGGTRLEIEDSLRTILGSDFVAYVVNEPADATLNPAALGDWPMNLQLPEVSRKIYELVEPITQIGVPFNSVLRAVGSQPALQLGDTLVFDVGRWGQMDRVTVDGFPPDSVAGTVRVTATFTRPHEAGVMGFTHPLPAWVSTKRHALIVVTAAVVADPETRRKINEQMARIARSVSTWDIVEGNETQTTQFLIGEPSIGRRTIEVVAVS